LLSLSFFLSMVGAVLSAAHGTAPSVPGPGSALIYLLCFGPALAYAGIYRRREREHGLRLGTAVLYVHLYVLYNLMWFLAGWRAVGRIVLRKHGWAKTERVAESPTPASAGTFSAPGT